MKLGITVIFGGLFYLWSTTVNKTRQLRGHNDELILPDDIPEGITMLGPAIINKSPTGMMVFSSKCTHLGCTIRQHQEGRFICPCHGSEYDETGHPVKGPAVKPLERLNYTRKNNQLIIKLST